MSTPAALPPDGVTAIDVTEVADADALRPTDPAGEVDGDVADRDELPLEADPADVAEQDAAVPYDDER